MRDDVVTKAELVTHRYRIMFPTLLFGVSGTLRNASSLAHERGDVLGVIPGPKRPATLQTTESRGALCLDPRQLAARIEPLPAHLHPRRSDGGGSVYRAQFLRLPSEGDIARVIGSLGS